MCKNESQHEDELLRLYADARFVDYDEIPDLDLKVWKILKSGQRELTRWELFVWYTSDIVLDSGARAFVSRDDVWAFSEDSRRYEVEESVRQALFRDDPDAKRRYTRFQKLCAIDFWEIRPLTPDERNFVDEEKSVYQRYGIRWPCRSMALWHYWKVAIEDMNRDDA